ncbi:hypothetical protein BT96DRAFT_960556 [Gymnopus androsaceus JB14]|uniref:CxC2-like cysteine cluster KDZ transposase-associated domain-containing protein n=1 Tax=Gymnopus androsaceus JB14 TaxID=1447944 RepID=A0A6A4GLC9_9AGAR|nr:hypothetical protein BT96DRAFT_960556 [Gymnopus androsaceus JB14]
MESDIAGGNYDPFWVGFPCVDIHCCISPDILHQLYQGVLKHLIGWVQEVMREDELDARIQCLPPACGVCHFKNGILELAQYPSHDEETLHYLQEELDNWHKYWSYFTSERHSRGFNILKFHSLLHFIKSIHWLGTTDNYNMEMFECLHIDFAKEGWKASNKQEKIVSYDFCRSWLDEFESENAGNAEEELHRDGEDAGTNTEENMVFDVAKKSNQVRKGQIILAKYPAESKKSLAQILISHALTGILPLDVWHQYKLSLSNLFNDELDNIQETVKAIPVSRCSHIPQFDTLIVMVSNDAQSTALDGSSGQAESHFPPTYDCYLEQFS